MTTEKIARKIIKKLLSNHNTTYIKRLNRLTFESICNVNIIPFDQLDSNTRINIRSVFPNYRGIKYHLNEVIRELQKDKTSRRAIIPVFNRYHMHCTVAIQVLIRHNKLNMIVFARSVDAENKMINDLNVYNYIANKIAKKLDIEKNILYYVVGSLHIYE